jgi:hypothetical protein
MDTEGKAAPPSPELDQALARAIRQLIAEVVQGEEDRPTSQEG